MTTLGDLGSIFQLTTGAALALSVFRAPYEEQFRKLSAILDVTEATVKGRNTPEAVALALAVAECRGGLSVARREVEPKIDAWMKIIHAAILLSAALLVGASLFNSTDVSIVAAVGLITLSIGPIVVAYCKILAVVELETAQVKAQIKLL